MQQFVARSTEHEMGFGEHSFGLNGILNNALELKVEPLQKISFILKLHTHVSILKILFFQLNNLKDCFNF